MEEQTKNNEKVHLERRKGISFNLELHKNPKDYPIFPCI